MAPEDSRAARAKAKKERQKRIAQLRSKSTGLIATSEQQGTANKKSLLDDTDHRASDDDSSSVQNETSSLNDKTNSIAEDDSKASDETDGEDATQSNEEESDDEVEEVKGSDARELAAMATDDTIHDVLAKKPKKRKRKPKPEETALDTFDDEFFQRLEEEKQESEKARKAAATIKGRRTTFVVDDDTSKYHGAVNHDHNIQVVVMNESSKPSGPPSTELLAYSKLRLKDGILPATRKRPAQATWKRSKTAVNRQRKVRSKAGQAAIHFTKQK